MKNTTTPEEIIMSLNFKLITKVEARTLINSYFKKILGVELDKE